MEKDINWKTPLPQYNNIRSKMYDYTKRIQQATEINKNVDSMIFCSFILTDIAYGMIYDVTKLYKLIDEKLNTDKPKDKRQVHDIAPQDKKCFNDIKKTLYKLEHNLNKTSSSPINRLENNGSEEVFFNCSDLYDNCIRLFLDRILNIDNLQTLWNTLIKLPTSDMVDFEDITDYISNIEKGNQG